jgi:hypothetical protein
MNPFLFGKAAKEVADLVELLVIARPFYVMFESQQLVDRHRMVPRGQNQGK